MATREENVKKLQGNREILKKNIFVPVSGYGKMAGKVKGKHKFTCKSWSFIFSYLTAQCQVNFLTT